MIWEMIIVKYQQRPWLSWYETWEAHFLDFWDSGTLTCLASFGCKEVPFIHVLDFLIKITCYIPKLISFIEWMPFHSASLINFCPYLCVCVCVCVCVQAHSNLWLDCMCTHSTILDNRRYQCNIYKGLEDTKLE